MEIFENEMESFYLGTLKYDCDFSREKVKQIYIKIKKLQADLKVN